jgi:small subunit ribosomal protein S3
MITITIPYYYSQNNYYYYSLLLLLENRPRRIEELQMNVQKKLNCVNRKLKIAILVIANPYGNPNILAELLS